VPEEAANRNRRIVRKECVRVARNTPEKISGGGGGAQGGSCCCWREGRHSSRTAVCRDFLLRRTHTYVTGVRGGKLPDGRMIRTQNNTRLRPFPARELEPSGNPREDGGVGFAEKFLPACQRAPSVDWAGLRSRERWIQTLEASTRNQARSCAETFAQARMCSHVVCAQYQPHEVLGPRVQPKRAHARLRGTGPGVGWSLSPPTRGSTVEWFTTKKQEENKKKHQRYQHLRNLYSKDRRVAFRCLPARLFICLSALPPHQPSSPAALPARRSPAPRPPRRLE